MSGDLHTFASYCESDNSTTESVPTASALSDTALSNVRVFKIMLLTYNVILICQSVLILCGNSLTLFAIIRFKKLHTNTNVLIASLSAADCLHGIWPFIGIVMDLAGHSFSAATWMRLCHVLTVLSMGASLIDFVTVAMIALERFVSVVYPMQYTDWVNRRRLINACVVAWLVMVGQAVFMTSRTPFVPHGMCAYGLLMPQEYKLGLLASQMWIYTIVTTVTYLKIARVAWVKIRQPTTGNQNTNRKTAKQQTITNMMALVLGTYFILYLPAAITIYVAYDNIILHGLFMISLIMWWAKSLVNPFIYAAKNKDFNRVFRTIICAHRRGQITPLLNTLPNGSHGKRSMSQAQPNRTVYFLQPSEGVIHVRSVNQPGMTGVIQQPEVCESIM